VGQKKIESKHTFTTFVINWKQSRIWNSSGTYCHVHFCS